METTLKDINEGHPFYYRFFRAVAGILGGTWLGRQRVDPNKVTLAGAALCLLACIVWACQVWWSPNFWFGLPLAVVGGWFDLIDGHVARVGGRATEFGKNLDSIMDRVVEGFMFAALAFVGGNRWAAASCALALAGSFTVTFTRAKAENYDLSGKAGFGGRGERLAILGVGVVICKLSSYGWFGGDHFNYGWAAVPVFVLTIPTIVQRLKSLKMQLAMRGTP